MTWSHFLDGRFALLAVVLVGLLLLAFRFASAPVLEAWLCWPCGQRP